MRKGIVVVGIIVVSLFAASLASADGLSRDRAKHVSMTYARNLCQEHCRHYGIHACIRVDSHYFDCHIFNENKYWRPPRKETCAAFVTVTLRRHTIDSQLGPIHCRPGWRF